MNRTLHWLAALAALLTCLTRTATAGETNAAMPYQTFENIFRPIGRIDQSKLEVHVFCLSTNKAVRPSDIRLMIHSAAKGLIPVELNTNGQVVRFPLEKDLHRENPLIVANQPAGTMRYEIAIQLPPTNALAFRYHRLGDGVAEMNKSIRAQAGLLLSLFAPKVRGVVFFFPQTAADKARVEIESAAGKKTYTADNHGRIQLTLDKALLAEDPEVVLSEKPQHIVPDMSGLR